MQDTELFFEFCSRRTAIGEWLLAEGNEEMSWHLVNWLLDRSHLLAIGPRPIKVYQFSMTRKNRRDLAGWLLGIVPGGIMGLGLMVWLRRRY